MPTSAPGNKRFRGFTLLELMVVVAIIAITSAVVAFAIPDPSTSRLEREAARLVALLESARGQARAGGMTVLWIPRGAESGADYQFLGLPQALVPSLQWMEREVRAEVVGSSSIVLGPEPVIGAQSLILRLGDQQLVVSTDGLSPFAPVLGDEAQAGTPEAVNAR